MKSSSYKRSFQEGFDSCIANSVGTKSGHHGYAYIRSVEKTIDELDDAMNKPYYGSKASMASIRGFIFEERTAGSFNIRSAVAGSYERAATVNLNPIIDFTTGETLAAPDRAGLASPDIVTTFGEDYGLKCYKDAVSSVISQAKTLNERYSQYLRKHPGIDLDSYCKLFNIDEGIRLDDSIYKFQKMLIPTDQLSEGEEYALKRIIKAINDKSSKVIAFEEVYGNLTDRITSPSGIESDPYTREMADIDAELVRTASYDPAMDGYTIGELIKFKQIVNQGFKTGERAAITTFAMKIGPEVCNLILQLIKNEKVSKEDIKKFGIKALSAASQGYINGFLAGSLTTACAAGHFGNSFVNVDASFIGAITSYISATMIDSIKACKGEIGYTSFIDNTLKNIMVTGGSVLGGKLMESFIFIPVVSYMVGSFIGASLAASIYSSTKVSYMSYVVDRGFTIFGLVDQDYSIPEQALKDIGVDIYEYQEYNYKRYNLKEYNTQKYSVSGYKYNNTLSFTIIKRGVIGINKVGYVISK